jgi:hypothetical protein
MQEECLEGDRKEFRMLFHKVATMMETLVDVDGVCSTNGDSEIDCLTVNMSY